MTDWISVLSHAAHVRVEDEHLVLPLTLFMEKEAAGTFEVEVQGPSRPPAPLVFRFWPEVHVEALPRYVLPGPQGHTDVTFFLRVPPGCTVHVQEGEEEEIEVTATEQPGRFRVRVGPESVIAPLYLVRRQNETTLAEVPVHIGIPRLRWLLELGEGDVPKPQSMPVTRPMDAFLQQPRAFLILEWALTASPDVLPAMRLVLLDPNQRPPRVLQESEEIKPLQPGRHRQVIDLGPFRDTVRAHKDMPLLSFDLSVLEKEPRRFPLVHLTRAPEVQVVYLEWREDGQAYVHWREPRPLRHRRITLWPASQPWRAPVQWPIPDVAPRSDRYTDGGWWMVPVPPEHDVPPGAYWVAFHAAHEWEPLKPAPHPPDEAFFVIGIEARERLHQLAEEASSPPDEFLRHFERAAWYDCLKEKQARDEETRWLVRSLDKAHPEHIVALARWLERRAPFTFTQLCIMMYKMPILQQKGILTERTPTPLRREYMRWFSRVRLIRSNTAILVLEADVDLEYKAHALSVLIKQDVAEGVFYGLWLLDKELFSLEDVVSIFQTRADDVVQELHTSFSNAPRTSELIEALLPSLSQVTVFQKHARIEAKTKHDTHILIPVGHITEVLVNGEPKSFAFPDERNIVLRVHLDGVGENPVTAQIDVTNKKIRFLTEEDTLFCCTKCNRFIASSREDIHRHHSLKHADPGRGASFIPFSPKIEYALMGDVKVIEHPNPSTVSVSSG